MNILKLSCAMAMVGHVEMLFGHVVGFVFQNGFPSEAARFEVGCGELCWIYLGVKCKDLGPRLGPSLAILDHVKVSGSYSSASRAKLELSQAILSHVEAKPICQIFLAMHQEGFPPPGPRF